MGAKSQLEIIVTAMTTKAEKELKGLTGAADKFKSSFQNLTGVSIGTAGAIALAGKAVQTGIQFTKEAITETVAYSKEVRELGQITGLTSEETSRLIQVGDDWGISIDDLRTAMQMAVKNGMVPSIDNLAVLADEYVNATDKTVFAEKATKLFGRQWTTLVPMLAKGGDALRDQAEAIDDNLLVTDEMISTSREYEVAVDDLNDTVQGLKYELGQQFIPVLTDVMNELNRVAEEHGTLNDAIDVTTEAIKLGMLTEEEQIEVLQRMTSAQGDLTEINAIADDVELALRDTRREGIAAMQDAKVATEELSDAGNESDDVYRELIKSLGDYNMPLAVRRDLEKELLGLMEGPDGLTQAEKDRNEALGFLTAQLALGKIDRDDYLDWVSDVIEENKNAKEIIDAVALAINNLPTEKDFTYNIKIKQTGGGKGIEVSEPGPPAPVITPEEPYVPGPGMESLGGPVMGGSPYIVGNELFVPNTSGYIVNNWNLTANYGYQSPNNLAQEIRLLEMLYS